MKKELPVSKATIRNWKLLNVSEDEIKTRLTKRANKLNSSKQIVPVEYFRDKNNKKKVLDLIELIKSQNLNTKEVIYNIALNLLLSNKLIKIEENEIISNKKNIPQILDEFKTKIIDKTLIECKLPEEEDILGIIYQILMSEGQKNKKGSYYTPNSIISELLKNIKEETVFLDPCCGTGSFLLKAAEKIKKPQNIYGIDFDNIACFISKINLVIKYKKKDFYPNIYNEDFLSDKIFEKVKKQFDVIATNPPWGSFITDKKLEINSKESFSFFIFQSEKFITKNGFGYFVLPESILNVHSHKDIRKFILNNFSIKEIRNWGKVFHGVLSDVVTIKLQKSSEKSDIKLLSKGNLKTIKQSVYINTPDYKFNFIDNKEEKILKKVYSTPYSTLENSDWGLGIVTGNNKKHISLNPDGREKIYTGKEIQPFFITDTDKYIKYNRTTFQQTAPDEIYRADEKLVYKFISNKLIFAYDNEKRLFLNSANILIPKVKSHSIKTVLGFLNSELFQFIYSKKFNEIKILKRNLNQLPFPILNREQKEYFENIIDRYMETGENKYFDKMNEFVYKIFNL